MAERIMDQQQDNAVRLRNLYDNIKKLGTDRREQKHLHYQEELRQAIWNQMEECHKKILQFGAPQGYDEKFKEAETVNGKIKNKLKEFGYIPPVSSITQNPTADKLTDAQNKSDKPTESQPTHASDNNQTLIMILQKLLENQESLQNRQDERSPQNLQLKPQKVKIPIFSGDITQYKYFKEATIRVLNNVQWGNIERFVFLKEHLQDDPLKMINVLQMEVESYNKAWEILDKCYDSQRRLVNCNVRLITNTTYCTKEKDIFSLKDFRHTFEAVRANFSQMQVTSEQLLAEITISRLDKLTASRFEDYIGYTSYTPSLEQISEFLIKEELQHSNVYKYDSGHRNSQNTKTKPAHISRAHVTQDEKAAICFICKTDEHLALQCPAFITASDKIGFMKLYKLCIFCGKHRYDRKNYCKSRDYLKCGTCNGRHVTELHPAKSINQSEINVSTSQGSFVAQPAPSSLNNANSTNTLITQQKTNECSLMPTVIANIIINKNQTVPVRCLIDQCAERSYISERLANSLGLKRYKTNEIIKGINNVTTFANNYVQLCIKFKEQSLGSFTVDALILPQITGKIPRDKIPSGITTLNLELADPGFGNPDNVEVLLGNDVSSKIFKNNEPIRVTEEGLVYQSTNFGWIISGNAKTSIKSSRYVSSFVTLNECNQSLDKDVELSQKLTEFYSLPEKDKEDNIADDFCEELFKSKHYRLPNGRYVVPIPWIPNAHDLGNSYYSTRACFINQENKWIKEPIYYKKSNEFMTEYFKMGHMVNIPEEEQRKIDTPSICYIPYISIVRKDAYSTKLRNVFNASSKTSNGATLNDTMFEGKKLQNKIFDIITRCRGFKYMYSADIVKMFRQIMILPEDRDKLRIIWRHNQLAPLNEFKLTTVTYGTDAAPWQAIRTIHQCAQDNAPTQQIREIIKSSFYVDDLLYGADTIPECKQQIRDISLTMTSGKFPLSKWMSNEDSIIDEIPADKRLLAYVENKLDPVKILGLIYDKTSDCYNINITSPVKVSYTKRGIASVAASFYDPIGFILPFVMLLRIFLRTVWAEHVDWDEKLNDDLSTQFDKYISKTSILKSIKIPRWIGTLTGKVVELIGFSDASNDAQAAVIYNRVKVNDKYIINLIAAKGNVNKLKTMEIIKSKQQTIPKLELEAIFTLASLYDSIKTCFSHLEISFAAYTDSQIALAWVRNNKVNQKIIRRKVDKILKIINPEQLHYVNGSENPADPASRGLTAEKMVECDLYYNGPTWLQDDILPATKFQPENDNDNSKCFVSKIADQYDMFHRLSNLRALIKVTALILKWRTYKKNSTTSCYERYSKPGDEKLYFHYHADEIENARKAIVKHYQQLHLGEIVDKLEKNHPVPVAKGHWLYKLSPYLDSNGLIRVGGRLNYAEIPENLKHPIAIPESYLKKLIIMDTHNNHMHAGNSLMLRLINENYWIPALRSSIHHFINKCVTCARWRNRRIQPQMSHLPTVRVNQALPFEHVGVDLAGPFQIKSSQLRKAQIIKVWVITFICMLTKALHLEITTSCDTEHFLAAFDRFSSRRGVPKQVWSDNGKNFIGASRLLNESWKKISREVRSELAIREIKWIFIPRYSPSFGGLWEASVKSLKYFTNRMKDIRNLTFEEFSTLLCKVEALLNSRPITTNPISPFEDCPITPFHFLTHKGMAADPIVGLGSEKSPLKKKWLQILQLQMQLWKRFKGEYFSQLQRKHKWVKSDREICANELVLIDDHNSTPGEWKMGRVIKTHQDKHGIARRADVKNSEGKVIVESIKNLIPLNILDANESVPRHSLRSHKITPTQVLLVWLACTSSAKAFNVTTLGPGIHIFSLGHVYMKAIDLDFTVDTGYNVTADISAINTQKFKFDEFCTQTMFPPLIKNHCNNMMKIIEIDTSEILHSITGMFKVPSKFKTKRVVSLARFGSQAAKLAIKKSPEILLTAGLVWQAHEISELESKIQEVEKRTKEVTQSILTILKTEEKDLEANLRALKMKQDEEALLIAINTYTAAFNTILSTIGEKYNQLKRLQPYEALQSYVQKMHQYPKFQNLILPSDIKNIFSDVTYKLVDDIILISYKIPLAHKDKLQKLAILSIPTTEHESIKLPHGNEVMYLIINSDQSEYINIIDRDTILYENTNWIPTNKCLSAILQLAVQKATDTCTTVSNNLIQKKIIPIQANWTAIHTANRTLLLCDDKVLTYNESYLLINIPPNCTMEIDDMIIGNIQGKAKLAKISSIPDVTIPIIKSAEIHLHNKYINKLIRKIEETEKNETINIQPWHWGIFCIIIIIILIAIILLCYYRKFHQSKKNNSRWFPDWTGPALEMTDHSRAAQFVRGLHNRATK